MMPWHQRFLCQTKLLWRRAVAEWRYNANLLRNWWAGYGDCGGERWEDWVEKCRQAIAKDKAANPEAWVGTDDYGRSPQSPYYGKGACRRR